MKKAWICLLLALSLLLSLGVFACAEGTVARSLDYVTDEAGILSEAETQSLNKTAAQLSEQYGCSVYILVVPDYRELSGGSIAQCSETVFRYYGLGYGEDHDGLILLMSMEDRDYDLWGHGAYVKYAFTEYALDNLEDAFLPYFRQNDWYGGFSAYLRGTGQILDAAASGEPVAYRMPLLYKVLLSLVPSSLIGFIVCGVFRSQMKTAKEKQTAEDYVVSGSVHLHVKEDQFLHTTRTVQVIESNSGHSGHSGGGTSHHSGKF